jgi:hypothetical protein
MTNKGGYMTKKDSFRGALLAGACGDALGYPLQELSVERIRHRFGPFGLRTLIGDSKSGKLAPVTGNTQLTLVTVDGLLWSDAKKMEETEGIYRGHMRWFYSQTGEEPRSGQKTWMRRQPHEREICLVREKFMHQRRILEEGVLNAFAGEIIGTTKNKVNNSKGSAVLNKVVPIGLLYAGDSQSAFELAVKSGAFSHSHPTAYYGAGAMAALVAELAGGLSLPKSLAAVYTILNKLHKADTIISLLHMAEHAANQRPAGVSAAWEHIENLSNLGKGNDADEALAMAVYCALAVDDPMDSVIVAANHGGNSATVAALTGAIQGVRFGEKFIPAYWRDLLEGHDVILGLSEMLYHLYEKKNRRYKKTTDEAKTKKSSKVGKKTTKTTSKKKVTPKEADSSDEKVIKKKKGTAKKATTKKTGENKSEGTVKKAKKTAKKE